jgi:hypothetical protein
VGLGLAGFAISGALAVTVWVQRESGYRVDHLSDGGGMRALVLYHPSRDAAFSDDLSLAVAEGLAAAGLAVDRATLTSLTPERPGGYAIVAVVSNTYYWAPDRPTLRYLRRARLEGTPVLGIIGGAGSTARSERLLEAALEGTGPRCSARAPIGCCARTTTRARTSRTATWPWSWHASSRGMRWRRCLERDSACVSPALHRDRPRRA